MSRRLHTRDPFEYEFTVDGELSERALAAFPELRAEVDRQQIATKLTGELPDTAAARGVIARLDQLGLTLLSFRRFP